MTLDVVACMRLLEELSRHNAIRANVKSSLRSGAIVGASTVVGSVLLGPVGVAAGAAMGTAIAYKTGNNNYVSIVNAVNQLQPNQKAKLVEELNAVVSSLSYDDVLVVQAALVSGAALSGLSAVGRAALVGAVRAFFSSNTSFTIDGA